MKEIVERVIENRQFPRTLGDHLNFSILLFPLGCIAVGCFMIYLVITRQERDYFLPAVGLIIAGPFLLWFTLARLKDNIRFDSYPTGKNVADNISLVMDALGDELWVNRALVYKECGLIEAQTGIPLFSWGEEISIICLEGEVLINSKPYQPLPIFKDRRNLKKIKQALVRRLEAAPWS